MNQTLEGEEARQDKGQGARLTALGVEFTQLYEALKAYVVEVNHTAPDDCYSSGPRTGDFIQDHVACPGCAVLEKARAALKAAGAP